MITIFKTGEIKYPESLNKPVKYDIDFLKSIASSTASAKITREHSDDVLGVLSNFVVEDGCLKADEPEGLELKGMGFSPVFEFDLLEYDSYFKPVNGVMTEIGFSHNPYFNRWFSAIAAKISQNFTFLCKKLVFSDSFCELYFTQPLYINYCTNYLNTFLLKLAKIKAIINII